MESLFLLVLSMLAIESADSIRLLYKHFLSRVTEKSLNAFYYACSYAKIDCSKFMNVTARLAMQIIPESLQNEPVFLCIDDTMIAKFGKKFENVSKLFDHAAHNGSNYLNGHCFVSLMLCVPVWKRNKIVYQSIPLGYRMWTKEVSKLELAADMVRTVMPELEQKNQVLLLFDSWYAKKALVCLAGNTKIWISSVMPDTILQFMISHRLRLEKGEDLPSEENVFLSRKIFLFQMKRLEIIMWVSVEYSQIYLGTNVSTHM